MPRERPGRRSATTRFLAREANNYMEDETAADFSSGPQWSLHCDNLVHTGSMVRIAYLIKGFHDSFGRDRQSQVREVH